MSTKKNSLRNLTRFHGGFFELEIPESFTRAFFQALYSALLKNEIKNLLKKDASHLKTT